LNLPREVEAAAVLLFKSFSYLGSYPACSPIPLSFEAFITAFVIFIGRLDTEDHRLSESLFFQSLSILPFSSDQEEEEAKDSPTTAEEERKEEDQDIPNVSSTATEDTITQKLSRGLSLAELGVDFNDDLDFDTTTPISTSLTTNYLEEGGEPEILCRDLIELFVLLLYLGEADVVQQHDFERMRETAESIVKNIKHSTKDKDSLPCISHHLFRQWQDKLSPHLFKPLKSLVIKSFTYQSNTEDKSRLLPEDRVPIVDKSDILTPLYSTLLSWTLPQNILVTKKWTRLYSADANGFSMNRFESHVFKYPGPTLFIIQIDATAVSGGSASFLSPTRAKNNKHQSMLLGAYITQPWKHSKQFWGTSECFLFELDPSFDVYKPLVNKTSNNHYIYYHHEFGIGFGATTSSQPHLPSTADQQLGFILSLTNTLQQGTYENETYPSNPTFLSCTGPKDFFYKFDTENIEVFGLGNEKDRTKQAKEWQFEKQEAARRSGLNIRKADGQLDKELLKMAGIIDEDKRQDR
jgi:hypothetical protein